MKNQLIWMDIPVVNLSRAIKFYEAVLAAPLNPYDLAGEKMALLPQEPGAVSGCLVPASAGFQPSTQGVQVYLNCDGRLEAAVGAVEAKGGKILQPAHAMGEKGYRAIVLDSEGNRLALCSGANPESVERMIRRSKQAIRNQPHYPRLLLELARTVERQGHQVEAYELCKRALALGAQDPQVAPAARRLLAALVPGYHGPMVNDERRNAAWDKALRRAIGPTTRALEIGTGTGMLAMMAARAGAARVTTCEYHPVVAAIAQEVVAKNGFQERVKVLAKSSMDLRVGVDLEEPADVLFCDNFADGLFGFRPLQSITDARKRLLQPGAVVLPGAAAAVLALADWSSYRRCYQMDQSCGFDVSALADVVGGDIDLDIGAAGMTLMSPGQDIFRFEFSGSTFPEQGHSEILLEASQAGQVNGIVQWIRLELDAETNLEARPEEGASFFSNPRFYPLARAIQVEPGDVVRVQGEHDGQSLTISQLE